MARIKRGEKLVGQAAIAAAGLGLGELYRSEDGSFALSTTRTLGIKPPPSSGSRHSLNKINWQ